MKWATRFENLQWNLALVPFFFVSLSINYAISAPTSQLIIPVLFFSVLSIVLLLFAGYKYSKTCFDYGARADALSGVLVDLRSRLDREQEKERRDVLADVVCELSDKLEEVEKLANSKVDLVWEYISASIIASVVSVLMVFLVKLV